MGKYCRICGCDRPNEAFSGRGRGIGICKKCRRLPKAELQRIQDEAFLQQVLDQRNISQKNVEYFKEMRLRYSDELGEKAAAMAELGAVHPGRRRRYSFLYHKKRELYDRLVRHNLIEDRLTAYAADDEEEGLVEARNFLAGDLENDDLSHVEYDDEEIPF